MFDNTDSDLKTAINQTLRNEFTEQLLEEEIEQISENVSAILDTYMKTYDIDLQLLSSSELSARFDKFYYFLTDLDEKKLGLGEVV